MEFKMATTEKDKPSGKPRQRSRKGDQRRQKPGQPLSPKLADPTEEQISPMVASTDAAAGGAAAPEDAPLIAEGAPEDAPPIAEAMPEDAPPLIAEAAPEEVPLVGETAAALPLTGEILPADALSIRAVWPAETVTIQTIANAYGNYTRRSLQESTSFIEMLMAVRSFDNAIEVQTEFARQAYANFVAESQKICVLYGELAKQIFRPWESFVAKLTQARR
jgi:hypothetical protein